MSLLEAHSIPYLSFASNFNRSCTTVFHVLSTCCARIEHSSSTFLYSRGCKVCLILKSLLNQLYCLQLVTKPVQHLHHPLLALFPFCSVIAMVSSKKLHCVDGFTIGAIVKLPRLVTALIPLVMAPSHRHRVVRA
jgi:hypothetical protein